MISIMKLYYGGEKGRGGGEKGRGGGEKGRVHNA